MEVSISIIVSGGDNNIVIYKIITTKFTNNCRDGNRITRSKEFLNFVRSVDLCTIVGSLVQVFARREPYNAKHTDGEKTIYFIHIFHLSFSFH